MKHLKLYESNETELDYSKKGLTSLPELPKILKSLHCYKNKLTSLPELPNSLETLNCRNNELTSLPELPNSLKELSCYNNQLTKLAELPNSLKELYCYDNKLTSLPELPSSLEVLYCDSNKLTKLPELPNSLKGLSCYNNQFESPLSIDIIEKFNININNLYTVDRLNEFKTEEWQRNFLNEFPERYKDIDWLVLPQIKQEFDYLYTSEELGLI